MLDEICPATFEEMRQNEGIGSDNMTLMVVDFLQHNGGCNAKASLQSSTQNKTKAGAKAPLKKKAF
jgi:hypothetical protein